MLDNVKAADELNAVGPGLCHYIVADISVRALLKTSRTRSLNLNHERLDESWLRRACLGLQGERV
jgi:hypothetical protein